ncbi:MAG: DUF4239 domain-containing protein [Fimbriimonas sp.]
MAKGTGRASRELIRVFDLNPWLWSLAMFATMLLASHLGRRVGARKGQSDKDGSQILEGAILNLLGLLLAFTFSGAVGRMDHRRDLILSEANAIGTAYLRIDTLPKEDQPALRMTFRKYADARLAYYHSLNDIAALAAIGQETNILESQIWKSAVSSSQKSPSPATMSTLLPAINDMFDIATTRIVARQMHPPMVIYLLLAGIAVVSAFIAGLGFGPVPKSPMAWTIGYALLMSAIFFVILDIEHPRSGFFRVDDFDEVLVQARQAMESTP